MSDFDANFARFLEFHKENSRHVIEFLNILAKLNCAYYESLIAQGFNEDQALTLTQAHGFKLPRL